MLLRCRNAAAEIASSFFAALKTRLLNAIFHFVAKRRFQKNQKFQFLIFLEIFWEFESCRWNGATTFNFEFFAALKTRLLNAIFHFVAKSHYTE